MGQNAPSKGKKLGHALISWGIPPQIADSEESSTCGRCGAKKGIYGKDFGLGPDGNPVPIVDFAFDLTITEFSVSALCWRCGFSYVLLLKLGEPEPPLRIPPKPPKRKKKQKKP